MSSFKNDNENSTEFFSSEVTFQIMKRLSAKREQKMARCAA